MDIPQLMVVYINYNTGCAKKERHFKYICQVANN